MVIQSVPYKTQLKRSDTYKYWNKHIEIAPPLPTVMDTSDIRRVVQYKFTTLFQVCWLPVAP
jgi:hypothetical protein